jgi:hypothetical protein
MGRRLHGGLALEHNLSTLQRLRALRTPCSESKSNYHRAVLDNEMRLHILVLARNGWRVMKHSQKSTVQDGVPFSKTGSRKWLKDKPVVDYRDCAFE